MITMYRKELEDRCVGYLLLPDGTTLNTLERPWKDNERNVSCIPYGQYRITRNKTGRFQYFGVEDVPNRTHIEMHYGSIPTHSDGCILFTTQGDLDTLMQWFGDDDWYLEIRRMKDESL